MSGIPSVTLVLLFTSYLIASSSSATKYTWIVQSEIKPEDLPSNLNRETSHKLLLELLSKKAERELIVEMRNEFYTMATGKDFYRLVADENENKEYHAVAEASMLMSQKLSYMQLVNTALRTAMLNGAKTSFNHSDITKGLPAIKETIEKLMQDPPALNEEYKRLKNEALAKPLPADYKIYYYEIPKTLEEAKNIVAENLNNPYLKKLMVYSILGSFMAPRNETSYQEARVFVKSMVKLAKDPEVGAKIQTLYDEAVAENANKIEDVEGKNVEEKHLRETFIQVGKELLKTLENKVENDPVVKTKFAETKAEISKSR